MSGLSKTISCQSVARPRSLPLMPFSSRVSDSPRSQKCAPTVFGTESHRSVAELPTQGYTNNHVNSLRATDITSGFVV
jgi:hypothetical protein